MTSLQKYLPCNLVYRPVIQDIITLHPFYFIILAAKTAAKTATQFTNIEFAYYKTLACPVFKLREVFTNIEFPYYELLLAQSSS